MLLTKVFAKAGLDNETSAMCKHRQQFGLDVQCSAYVLNFNHIFSNEHLYRADTATIPCLRKYSTVSGNFMTTSEHIKNSTKKFKPTSQKINLYDSNVRKTSTRFFKIKDENGNGFKLYDFSDRILLETKVKTSLLFAVNQPDNICLANELLESNIYTDHSNDNSVRSCIALIRQDIQDIELQKNEALFVYGNAIQLLVDKTRQLIPEIEFLQKIKSTIEDKFPDAVEIVDALKIPTDLQDLVPYFKEWAISDDLERDEKIKKSSKSKLQKVIDIVNPKMNLINNYLDSFKDESIPYEATLIMSLAELVAELTLPKK